MMSTFGTPKLVLDKGEGCWVTDLDGNRYLDLLGGIAVNLLGHAHPKMVDAISKQAAQLMHVSNFFATPPQVKLAERLAALIGDGQVPVRTFFTNSGTEANEAAFKATRRTGRTKIIATEGSFHGRTMGALAITANPAYRDPFAPLPGEVVFVPYGDAVALEAALDDTVAAFVVEPIQGENGVVVPPAGYLSQARELTRAHGVLLWIDEVQTGIARTGEWWGHSPEGIVPDLVTVAKGLGGGFPMGACLAIGDAAGLLGPGQHGSTFGGNPLAARVGLTVLDVIEADGIMEHVRRTGDWLADELRTIPGVAEVRGRGLLLGIVLEQPISAKVADGALAAGFIINAPRPQVIRLAPPLIISIEELTGFVNALPGLIEAAQ